jgi:hypothetical protein
MTIIRRMPTDYDHVQTILAFIFGAKIQRINIYFSGILTRSIPIFFMIKLQIIGDCDHLRLHNGAFRIPQAYAVSRSFGYCYTNSFHIMIGLTGFGYSERHLNKMSIPPLKALIDSIRELH